MYLRRSKLTQPLSSTVIQEVANRCKENVGFALAYFYFDFTDPVKQKTYSLIGSFLTQLSFQLPVCPDVLLRLHAACHGGSQRASTPNLMKALKSITGHFHHVYFVIDALDECSDQDELLAAFTEIGDWKLHNSHVMAGGQDGSALASASARGHKYVVRILLENGADVNMAGSPLASASAEGHKDVVQILLEKGADGNMMGSDDSPLASAAAIGHRDVVQILLENGADVNMAGVNMAVHWHRQQLLVTKKSSRSCSRMERM